MASEEIDRARWGPSVDSVTKNLFGKTAQTEVAYPDLGDQLEAQRAPLIGVISRGLVS